MENSIGGEYQSKNGINWNSSEDRKESCLTSDKSEIYSEMDSELIANENVSRSVNSISHGSNAYVL